MTLVAGAQWVGGDWTPAPLGFKTSKKSTTFFMFKFKSKFKFKSTFLSIAGSGFSQLSRISAHVGKARLGLFSSLIQNGGVNGTPVNYLGVASPVETKLNVHFTVLRGVFLLFFYLKLYLFVKIL